MPTFALNFSRPGSQVIAQYYNFIRLGSEGYRKIHQACMDVVFALRDLVEQSEFLEVAFEDIKMPLLAFKLKEGVNPGFTVYDISEKLRAYGWQVPAYTLAKDCHDTSILRIVAKEGFTYDLASLLVKHLREVREKLTGTPWKPLPAPDAPKTKIC